MKQGNDFGRMKLVFYITNANAIGSVSLRDVIYLNHPINSVKGHLTVFGLAQ